MDTLKVTGLEVVKSFYSLQEPNITHARFEIVNSGSEAVNLTVHTVSCRSKDHLITVPEFYLYALPDYLEQENKRIEQAANTTSQFEISFPPVSAANFSPDPIMVEIEFAADADTIKVHCPYVIAFRTEKRTIQM